MCLGETDIYLICDGTLLINKQQGSSVCTHQCSTASLVLSGRSVTSVLRTPGRFYIRQDLLWEPAARSCLANCVLHLSTMELLLGTDIPLYLLLLPLACLLFYIYGTWPYGVWKSLGIDGPKPSPFIGNQHEMNTKGNENCVRKWSQTYGRTFGIYSGRRPLLVTTDLDLLKEILVKEFNRFTDRFDKFELFPKEVRANLFIIGGGDWKRVRSLLTPTFSTGKLKLMETYINRCSADLTENMRQAIRKGERIDVKKYFGGFTLDVISSTAFGIKVKSQTDFSDPFVKNVANVTNEAGRSDGFFMVLATGLPFLLPFLRLLRLYVFPVTGWNPLFKTIKSVIAARKTESDKNQRQTDFLEMIVKHEETEGCSKEQIKSLSRVEVFGQAMVFFAAGYETTATALQFLAYQLAKYPEVQEKVVQEMKREIGDEIPTYDGMAKLKYLDHVINETLRMFPPLNTINRTALETTTVKGVTIPQGAGVAVPIANILSDPEYFPEPDEFKPERFSEDNDVINPASFIVFGFGPRQCIGMRLALLEIKMAMVHVLRNMKFIPTDDLQEIPARQCGTFLSPLIRPLFLTAELR